MASVTSAAGRPMAQARAGSPLPTRERRTRYVALAVIILVGSTAVGAWLWSQAGTKTPVVVVVQPVPAGHAISRADVSTIAVAGGVTAIAGENIGSVIGQSAAVPLLPNMLLQRSMVTPATGPGPRDAEVGVAVTSGQAPADGLQPGDTVQVLRLPDDSASSRSSQTVQELVAQARVFAAHPDPAQAGGTILTLTVPASQAPLVAMASDAGKVALIKVAATS